VSLRLATGQAAFAGDQSLPGMLHVAIRRSPSPHARVRKVDAKEALELQGVAAVFTCEDAPEVLQREVRYVGDRLAVVAAEEPELARRAAALVGFELEALPARLDASDAAEPDVAARASASEGDVDQAIAGADSVVSGEWRLPFAPALSLEPPIALSWLDEERRLVVRTSAESPFRVRAGLAERLSVPAARIRVVRPAVAGGGLGRTDVVVEDACALVTLRTGRPAQLALSASEALAIAPGRPAQHVRLRLGLARGEIVGLEALLLVDVGATGEDAEELLRASARQALGLYRVPSLRFSGVAVRTNRPPASSPRGSDEALAIALECALDEAAAGAGQDATAMRRANLRRPGDPGAAALAALGEPAGGDDAQALAELLRRLPPGAGPRSSSAAAAGDSRRRRFGRGVAVARRAESATALSGAAVLRLLDDGSFALAAGPSAAGGADERIYADTAATILEVPTRRVVCTAPDTDSAPYMNGGDAPGGSAAGRAVEQVATLLRDRIREAGAALLGVPVAETSIAGGSVAGSGERSASFAQIGAAALRAGTPLGASAAPARAKLPPPLAAAAADVDVDLETGVVSVLALHAVVAGGPFADERLAAAQVEGGLAAALERALVAGLDGSDPGGPPQAWSRGLPLCTASDMPALAVAFVPGGDPLSRFDTAAQAEAAARAATAAIANAVARASGLRLRTLPLDPARLLAALPETEA
jgi:putative selenate reductase molybdopterin-binding subunit